MAAVIPTLLSPARVIEALASVGPPAGSGGGWRVDVPPGPDGSTTAQAAKSPSPSRMSAFPPTPRQDPSSPSAATAAAPDAGPSISDRPNNASSPLAPGGPGPALTPSRSGNSRRTMSKSKYSFSGQDSPRGTGGGGGRLPLVSEASAVSAASSRPSQRFIATSNLPYAVSAMRQRPSTTLGGGSSAPRDRSFSSVSGLSPYGRPSSTSISGTGGGWGGGSNAYLDVIGSQGNGLGSHAAGGGGGGGIDLTPLLAIQRILEEYESDENSQETPSNGREALVGEGSSSQLDSGSGLRTIASLRARGDMHNWQPSVSTVKGTLEQHQRRLKARSEVTNSLKRWTEHVLEDAKRQHGSRRVREETHGTSVRFADQATDSKASSPNGRRRGGGSAAAGGSGGEGEGPNGSSGDDADDVDAAVQQLDVTDLDPDQALDDDEERRLAALLAAPPNPRGLGAELRAHFLAVVEEEVNRKFDEMRIRWEEEKGMEAAELRDLREHYKDLRKTHIETKDALEKANTRMEVLRMQLKTSTTLEKRAREAAAAASANATGRGARTSSSEATAVPGFYSPSGAAEADKPFGRTPRASNHDEIEGAGLGTRTRMGGRGGTPSGGTENGDGGGVSSLTGNPMALSEGDMLHERLRNIGSRRPTSHTGEGSMAPATGDANPQSKATPDVSSLNRKLQDADQQIFKLRQEKTSLEQQLASAKASGGGKYDADVQIFKLKQEKATLEQQLAASHKAAASIAARNSAKTSRGPPPRAVKASGAKAAAAAAADRTAAEIERLESELAAARVEAALNARTAAERAAELEKVRVDLAQNQTTLSMAVQQITAVKEGIIREKERADQATAMAEAAEVAAAMAAAATAAANDTATSLLKQQLQQQQQQGQEPGQQQGSGEGARGGGDGAGGKEGEGAAAGVAAGATGEVLMLVERLERERDAAMAATGELRQQVRELTKQVGQRQAEAMELRDEIMKLQMTPPPPPPPSALPAALEPGQGTAVGQPTDGAAVQPQSQGPEQQRPESASGSAAASASNARLTAAAVAAMQSLGVTVRQPSPSRRRPSSAVILGASGYYAAAVGGGDFAGAAAAAAAAATLIPAVLDELRKLMPKVMLAIEADMDGAGAPPTFAAASGGGDGGAAAVSAAAAAASAAAREGADPATAAATGATVAAPTVARTLADLLRAEFMAGLPPPGPSDTAAAQPRQRGQPLRTGGSVPSSSRRGQSTQQSPPRAPAHRAQARAYAQSTAAAAAADHTAVPQQQQQEMEYMVTSVGVGELTGYGGGSGGGGDEYEDPAASSPPGAVWLDGLTFVPLNVEDAETGRRPLSASHYYAGHDHSPPHQHPNQQQQPQQLRPTSHSLFLEPVSAGSGAGAVFGPPGTAAGVSPEDLVPRAVVVAAPRPSGLASAEVRRRKSAFAQLHSSYFSPAGDPVTDDDGVPTAAGTAGEAGPMTPAAAAAAAATATARARAVRFSHMQRELAAAAAAAFDAADAYVDPNLAAVLHVERVSPAAARAAGAGRGAVSPEALGPSLRDRALTGFQPEFPPPPERPQTAAARALDAARQQLQQHSAAGRLVRPLRPVSAMLPPVIGALPAHQMTLRESVNDVSGPEGYGAAGGAVLLAGAGGRIRTITANPQKGIQLASRPRSSRYISGHGPAGGVRFNDDDTPLPSAAVTSRLSTGPGLTPPLVEVQLHTGSSAAAVASASQPPGGDAGGRAHGDAEEGPDDGGDRGPAHALPPSGPELAALARELMVAQGRANKELEQAMSARRELAEEVVSSRQQWLDEARRARDLEKELDSVRMVLMTMGVEDASGGGSGGPTGRSTGSRPATATAGGRSRPASGGGVSAARSRPASASAAAAAPAAAAAAVQE